MKISGNMLKILAALLMLIDHIGAVLLETTGLYMIHQKMDFILRLIGRMAFPIFCFLLVEGFIHTRNRKKYMLRLALFAVLSEIPFDLAFSNVWFDLRYQNVYLTLVIGLITLQVIENKNITDISFAAAIFIGCIVAVVLRTDYNAIGVLLIVLIYLLRYNKISQIKCTMVYLFIESINFYGAAALGMIPVYFYSGQRGKMNLKYFFYWFYPLHLILLILIRCYLQNKGAVL